MGICIKAQPFLVIDAVLSGNRQWLGDPQTAIDHLGRAMRLSPLDPLLCGMMGATAFAHFFARRYDEAAEWAVRSLHEKSTYQPALRIAAATNAMLGRFEEARNIMMRLRQMSPGLRISGLKDQTPLRRPQDVTAYTEGLRKAGLPE